MAPQALEENRMPHIEKPHIVEDRLERMILEAKLLLKGVQEVEQKTKNCQCEAKDSCEETDLDEFFANLRREVTTRNETDVNSQTTTINDETKTAADVIRNEESPKDLNNNTSSSGESSATSSSSEDGDRENQPPGKRLLDAKVFIKYLPDVIDAELLKLIFAPMGKIISTKVVHDKFGQSKCYGYIQFETVESANNAISKVDQMIIDGNTLLLQRFVPRRYRTVKKNHKPNHRYRKTRTTS